MPKFIYIFLILCSVGYSQTKMSTTESNVLRKKVKEQAAITKTIVSDFVQYKHLDFLANDIESSGKLAFKSPNMVKWAYVTPFQYAVIFKDEKLYINDEGKKSDVDLSSSKLFKRLNQLIISSVKGDMFNEEEFEITYFIKGNKSEVNFKPKNKKLIKYISNFQILFSTSGEVVEVKMIEPSGDYTQIIFKNRKVNTPLLDAVFIN